MGEERETLAALVRARRRALGLTRHALATRAGVDRDTLAFVEGGRTVVPARTTLVALDGALDLPLAALEAALPPDPAAARAERGLRQPRPYGCLGCGRARGEAQQALLARIGTRAGLWLCHDCAEHDARVAELVTAYRRGRTSGE